MTVAIGDTLPDASLIELGSEGPAAVSLSDAVGDGKTVIFGLPGAYTGTCSTAHVPSFIRNMDQLKEKGVSNVICVSVNDPFVMGAWSEATGANAAGIRMLGDAEGTFTDAIGMTFSAPPVGLINRSKRYTMLVEGGKVTHLNIEESPGVCELSAAETLLDQL